MSDSNNDIVDFPVAEMFADGELKVISYKGENYYRGCNAYVMQHDDGSTSHCVKPVDHTSPEHEDYYGNRRLDYGFQTLTLEEAVYQALGAASVCWENVDEAGVFDDVQAKAIGEQLMDRIDQELRTPPPKVKPQKMPIERGDISGDATQGD
jgi:hypothetical protein